MRKPIVIGNWKMNKTAEQATLLIADLLPELKMIQEGGMCCVSAFYFINGCFPNAQ